MLSAEATDRSAATAGLVLVARLVGIVEVRAARSLKQAPRGGRLVAQLTRRAGDERARGQAIVTPHAPIRREIGVADQRADAVRTEPEGQEASIRKPVVADIHALLSGSVSAGDGAGGSDDRSDARQVGPAGPAIQVGAAYPERFVGLVTSASLRYPIDLVGADRLMIGSDD
jgi:hypothetical protein